jgi:hypothetical protein
LLVWSWFFGLGKNVDGGFDQGVADVVVEEAARNFFELLVADDFRSDVVAHFGCGVELKVVSWSWFFGLGKNVDGGFDQGVADVVVEQTARNFFKLLVADNFRIFRSDFVAHFIGIGIGWIG